MKGVGVDKKSPRFRGDFLFPTIFEIWNIVVILTSLFPQQSQFFS